MLCGPSAKMWSPFFKNDGMFKTVTAEHWSYCRHFSVRVPWGCPGCTLGSQPWPVAIFLAADSFPLPLLQAKTRWPTGWWNSRGLTMVGPWTLPQGGPANKLLDSCFAGCDASWELSYWGKKNMGEAELGIIRQKEEQREAEDIGTQSSTLRKEETCIWKVILKLCFVAWYVI